MYLNFFNLEAYPFQVAPDPNFLYLTKAHARAKAYLDYAIWSPDGFVVITGEIGCGKTILIKKVLSQLPNSVMAVKVFQTQVDEIEFLQLVLAEFGFQAFDAKKVELINTLNRFLVNQHQQQRRVVIIVDEAQNLNERVLEEIRLLSGLETNNERMLSVILAGQTELKQKLDSAGMQQLAQRVQLRFHIRPLGQTETNAYIEHRLKVAGAQNPKLFPLDTIPLIHRYTGGVPRLINILCDTILTAGFVDNISHLSSKLVNAAIVELQWRPYSQRMHANIQRNAKTVPISAAQPSATQESTNIPSNGTHIEEKLNRLYDFVPKFAANVTGRINSIDEQLKQLTALLRQRK